MSFHSREEPWDIDVVAADRDSVTWELDTVQPAASGTFISCTAPLAGGSTVRYSKFVPTAECEVGAERSIRL